MAIYKNIVTDADDTVTTLIDRGGSVSGAIRKYQYQMLMGKMR